MIGTILLILNCVSVCLEIIVFIFAIACMKKYLEKYEYSGVKSITCPVFGNHYSV